jgi:hypothetical protein
MKSQTDDCRNTLRLFPDAEAGDLSPEREREVRAHLDGCDACARAWEGMELAIEAARAALVPEAGAPPVAPLPEGAPLGYWERFLPRLRRRIAADARARRGPRRPVWALPAAAALVLGFCLGAGAVAFMPRATGGNAGAPGLVAQDSVLEEMPDYREDLLLPLAVGSPWEDTLLDTVETLDDKERTILLEELFAEIS